MTEQHEYAYQDEYLLVTREALYDLLDWAARQPCGAVPKAAQTRLEAELMAKEPPERWFDTEPKAEPIPIGLIVAWVVAVLGLLGAVAYLVVALWPF